MTERTFNVFTGNAASDRFCNSTYVEAGTAEQPVRLLLFRGESHREFMIELDSGFKPVAMQVRRERGRMVERPTEVGKGSCTRLAMLPAWESAGWDEWTAIELKTHELDAPALMEGFIATKEGRDFLFGIEKKKEEPKKVPAQPDRLVEIDGYWFRAVVERGSWSVYALGRNRDALGEWIGTVEEPTKEEIIEADARFAEACE